MSEDCTGDPPGELMISATAAGLPRAKAFSISGSRAESFRPPPPRPPDAMVPCNRITATRGGFLRKGMKRFMLVY
jgi:hypothetical protein